MLFFILSDGTGQDVFLVKVVPIDCRLFATLISPHPQIDRFNDYRHLQGLYFPHHENRKLPLGDTILDGELLIDTDPTTGGVGTLFFASAKGQIETIHCYRKHSV